MLKCPGRTFYKVVLTGILKAAQLLVGIVVHGKLSGCRDTCIRVPGCWLLGCALVCSTIGAKRIRSTRRVLGRFSLRSTHRASRMQKAGSCEPSAREPLMGSFSQSAHPSLYNSDLAPVSPGARTWGAYNFACLWISMSVCIQLTCWHRD